MSVIDKLRKRRAYEMPIAGETVKVRSLLNSEFDEIRKISDDIESIGAAIGFGLLNEDSTQAIVRNADETIKQFGARVLATLDLPTDTQKELSDKIMDLTVKGPAVEKLAKN